MPLFLPNHLSGFSFLLSTYNYLTWPFYFMYLFCLLWTVFISLPSPPPLDCKLCENRVVVVVWVTVPSLVPRLMSDLLLMTQLVVSDHLRPGYSFFIFQWSWLNNLFIFLDEWWVNLILSTLKWRWFCFLSWVPCFQSPNCSNSYKVFPNN